MSITTRIADLATYIGHHIKALRLTHEARLEILESRIALLEARIDRRS